MDKLVDEALSKISELGTVGAMQWLVESFREAQKASSPFATYWAMIEADNELAGEKLKDEEVALSFMGSGASTCVTVGQIRKMLDAIYQCKDGEPK